MRIILVMGTSSVGKSMLISSLTTRDSFKTPRNADEIIKDYLALNFQAKLTRDKLLEKLTPEMSFDEVCRFATRGQLNLSRNAKAPIRDKVFDSVNPKDDIIMCLVKAGIEHARASIMAEALLSSKQIWDNDKDKPSYEFSLEQGLKDVMISDNRDATVVIDLVPEATPRETREAVDAIIRKFEDFAEQHSIEVQFHRVLLYCKMQALFDNMRDRNARAEAAQDSSNKRVGINPVLQLASLVAPTDNTAKAMMHLSKNELRKLIEKYGPKDSGSQEALYEQMLRRGDGKYFHGFCLNEAAPPEQPIALALHPALGECWQVIENRRQPLEDITRTLDLELDADSTLGKSR